MAIGAAGAAAIASAVIGAGTSVALSNKSSRARKRTQAAADAKAQEQKEAQFQESERQKVAARKAGLFEKQAGQKIISDQSRNRNITPVFSDLSNAVLNPNNKATV